MKQIIIPTKYREAVMKLAHKSIVGGHLGVKKTTDRITRNFHWLGIIDDVSRFCKSCDICQRTITKWRVSKIALGTMLLIEEPFRRVATDLIVPLSPVPDNSNWYILTIVDYATKYPEAIVPPKIETEWVAEVLLEVFS